MVDETASASGARGIRLGQRGLLQKNERLAAAHDSGQLLQIRGEHRGIASGGLIC